MVPGGIYRKQLRSDFLKLRCARGVHFLLRLFFFSFLRASETCRRQTSPLLEPERFEVHFLLFYLKRRHSFSDRASRATSNDLLRFYDTGNAVSGKIN